LRFCVSIRSTRRCNKHLLFKTFRCL
jgi:hypothetical protein